MKNMKTTIINDPLLEKKIKLVYGTPIEGAMVHKSTANPNSTLIFDYQRFGVFLEITNKGENDPDKVKNMIWIREDSECPILGLVYGITSYIEHSCRPTIVKENEEFLPVECDAYYKSKLFSIGLSWLSEFIELPKVNNTEFEFYDEFSPSSIKYCFAILEKFELDKTGGRFYRPTMKNGMELKINITRNYVEDPILFWTILYHEVIHMCQYLYKTNINEVRYFDLIARLVLKTYKQFYDRII